MKRKIGASLEAARDEEPAPKKRKRTKTYVMLHCLNNMLKQSSGKQLSDFRPPTDDDNNFTTDPFSWNLLCLAPDMGPDMLCGAYALLYRAESKLNFQVDFDISHSLNNAAKCALRYLAPNLAEEGAILG